MEDTNTTEDATPAFTGPTHGPQGVDKAPGEEESGDTMQFEQLSQKGKKNDADPESKTDQPVNQSGLTDDKNQQTINK